VVVVVVVVVVRALEGARSCMFAHEYVREQALADD